MKIQSADTALDPQAHIYQTKSGPDSRYVYSRFNVVVDSGDGRNVIYNSASHILSVLSPDETKFYFEMPHKTGQELSPDEHGILDHLLINNFAVPADIDELDPVRERYMQHRTSAEGLTLTIAPTLNCNFNCRYCYQGIDKDQLVMSPRTQEKTISYIQQLTQPGSGIKSLSMTWFGGEPLLGLSAVKYISDRIIAWCDRRKLGYSAMMITNGYLLNLKTIGELYVRKVRTIQVTLDGDREMHNRIRYLKHAESPTFDHIVENIKLYSKEYPIQTNIRVNLDQNNAGSADKLIEQLAEAGLGHKNISIYFAPIVSSTTACRSVCDDTLDLQQYAEIEYALFLACEQAGFVKASLPPRFMSVCGAAKQHGSVIVANGDIHKCWETVSFSNRRTGHLSHASSPDDMANDALWNDFNPFNIPECRNCEILPNCAGFCAYKFIYNSEFAGKSGHLPCPSLKFNIRNKVLHYAKSHQML